jgi:hypothetical protein
MTSATIYITNFWSGTLVRAVIVVAITGGSGTRSIAARLAAAARACSASRSDRSIPPLMMTKVSPSDISAMKLKFFEMLSRLRGVTKTGARDPDDNNQGCESDGDIGGLGLRHAAEPPCGAGAGGPHRGFRGAPHQARSTAPVISAITSSGEGGTHRLVGHLLASA